MVKQSNDKTTIMRLSCPTLNFTKNERSLMKVFLIEQLHQLFCELFDVKFQNTYTCDNLIMEYYAMDRKLIQLLIQNIVDSQEYTLQGIATYTRLPFDVIFEASCGINHQFSITLWTKIAGVFLEINPELKKILVERWLEMRDKTCFTFSSLLNDPKQDT